ncbi:N-terminal domain of NEFA-interacting nuclear protein NIP30-domain-containing protein [Thelephora terrestris]|uniref:N-terminal domain of NEFA-interacting nuclear protein NIP30-domain-containing protein n=1 Tax=Thelephora terrestris TaxID=56493 RepID=A0A9P6L8V9_9AGAM|nr:N-terminal domain of NEFA-interacting nuclear protein NIP30-domain-containing protein [Thelephora terrestris]
MDADIPSLSSGSVGSRFVSQTEIDVARQRREEQWKAAYARLGQDPPPQQQEEVFDGRSLAEKLAANRAAKQEQWEERNKLGNQFRALEEDEVMFLDSIRERQVEEERKRKEEDGVELASFREAVAARSGPPPPPVSTPDSNTPKPKVDPPKPRPPVAKKDTKKSLRGVVVKKKSKVPEKTQEKGAKSESPAPAKDSLHKEDDDKQPAKKQKLG